MEKIANLNMRSKSTESDHSSLISLWQDRRSKITTRKSYEKDVEKMNEQIKKDVREILTPVAEREGTPFEVIIESNRMVLQKKIFFRPKAKGQYFTLTLSQGIQPLTIFMKNEKSIKQLARTATKWIRRTKAVTKSHLGHVSHPYNTNPETMTRDLKRQGDMPQVMVTLNVRTRYDF